MVYVPFMKDFSVQEKILFCQPLPARAKQDRSSRLWMIFKSHSLRLMTMQEKYFFRCILYLHISAVWGKNIKILQKTFSILDREEKLLLRVSATKEQWKQIKQMNYLQLMTSNTQRTQLYEWPRQTKTTQGLCGLMRRQQYI